MEADGMITGKPETIINRKQVLFHTLLPLIRGKIGREIKPHEKEAIAFAVAESSQEIVTAESFLSGAFGVGEGDTGRDAAMKIHNSVYEAKMREINGSIAKHPSDAQRLVLIRENIQIGHNRTLENYQGNAAIDIGGVQQDWIPAWFRSPNPALGQER